MDEADMLDLIADTLNDRDVSAEVDEDKTHVIVRTNGASFIVRAEEV